MKLLKLSQNKITLLDDEDFEKFSKYKWYATRAGKSFYAVRTDKQNKKVSLHRMILPCSKNKTIDHINGDTLDNRRINLRICSKQQNCFNQRKYKGILPYKGIRLAPYNRYQARLRRDGKTYYLGTYGSAVCAALAYDEAALKYFGKFANLNFPNLKRSTI